MRKITGDGGHVTDSDIGNHMAGLGQQRVVFTHDRGAFNVVNARETADTQTVVGVVGNFSGVFNFF